MIKPTYESVAKKGPGGVRTLCAQDTQDLFPGRQGSLGLESRGHSDTPPATDGHFEREAVLPAGRERNTHKEKALTAHNVALSRFRPSASCHSVKRFPCARPARALAPASHPGYNDLSVGLPCCRREKQHTDHISLARLLEQGEFIVRHETPMNTTKNGK